MDYRPPEHRTDKDLVRAFEPLPPYVTRVAAPDIQSSIQYVFYFAQSNMSPSDLESDLQAVLACVRSSVALPPELPVAHLTSAKWLASIIRVGRLVPKACKVFNEDLLYFSYGGVFYRTSKLQTEDASALPVAMVFRPHVLDACARLFPFDSGAMANGLFGDTWHATMNPFERRFVVKNNLSEAARLLVHCCYEENTRYIDGDPTATLAFPSPALTALHDFLCQDLSGLATVPNGIDHRQRSIELIASTAVQLAENLIWIGMPNLHVDETMAAIRRLTRTVPQHWPYHYRRNFHPDEYAAQLESRARSEVIERYAK